MAAGPRPVWVLFFAMVAVHAAQAGAQAVQQTKIVPAGAGPQDRMGASVAADLDRIVVGSPVYTEGGSRVGRVDVYERAGGTWTGGPLSQPVGGGDDKFGHAVAMSGDNVLVGAPDFRTQGGIESGGAVVYRLVEGVWFGTRLVPSDATAFQAFGSAVDLDGDVLAVGAPKDSEAAAGAGAAYVFERDGTTWRQEAKLLPPDAQGGEAFGRVVLVHAGRVFVATGPSDPLGAAASGVVHAYDRSPDGWQRSATLRPSSLAGSDDFGAAIAAWGDRLAVGAPMDDTRGSDAGAVYLFRKTGSTWTQETRLTAAAARVNDQLGASVGMHGNVLVAGAPGTDLQAPYGPNAGAFHVWVLDGGAWDETDRVVDPEPFENDNFGAVLDLRRGTVVVGLPAEDDAGTDSGGAYVFGIPYNEPPVARFTYDCDGLDCAFDASASTDADGSVAAYRWEFGDNSTAQGAMVTHVFPSQGEYTVLLTVTDDRGGAGQRVLFLPVAPAATTAPTETTITTEAEGSPAPSVLVVALALAGAAAWRVRRR